MNTLGTLPVEVLFHVVSALGVIEIARLGMVSRGMSDTIKQWIPTHDPDFTVLSVQQKKALTHASLPGIVRVATRYCNKVNLSGTNITVSSVVDLATWGVRRLTILDCPEVSGGSLAWAMARYAKCRVRNGLYKQHKDINIDIHMKFKGVFIAAYAGKMIRRYREYVRMHRVVCSAKTLDVNDPETDETNCHHCDVQIPTFHTCSNCYINFDRLCLNESCPGCPAGTYYHYHAANGKGTVCRGCRTYYCSLCIRRYVCIDQCYRCHVRVSNNCDGIDECRNNLDICPGCKDVLCTKCATDGTIPPDRFPCVRLAAIM